MAGIGLKTGFLHAGRFDFANFAFSWLSPGFIAADT